MKVRSIYQSPMVMFFIWAVSFFPRSNATDIQIGLSENCTDFEEALLGSNFTGFFEMRIDGLVANISGHLETFETTLNQFLVEGGFSGGEGRRLARALQRRTGTGTGSASRTTGTDDDGSNERSIGTQSRTIFHSAQMAVSDLTSCLAGITGDFLGIDADSNLVGTNGESTVVSEFRSVTKFELAKLRLERNLRILERLSELGEIQCEVAAAVGASGREGALCRSKFADYTYVLLGLKMDLDQLIYWLDYRIYIDSRYNEFVSLNYDLALSQTKRSLRAIIITMSHLVP